MPGEAGASGARRKLAGASGPRGLGTSGIPEVGGAWRSYPDTGSPSAGAPRAANDARIRRDGAIELS